MNNRSLAPDWLKVVALSTVMLLTACSSSSTPSLETAATPDDEITETPTTDDEITETPTTDGESTDNPETLARYRLTFNATWSEETHPLNFPANPHFSGLVGAVHNEQVRFWEPSQIASDGIQLMAETGNKSTLLSEVQDAIESGLALAAIDGGGIGASPGSTSIEFEVTRDYPEVTVTSMLAPSPDWFVGLHNYSLLNNGEFIANATIDLLVYDSGSDDGLQYTSANEATDPLSPISRLSSEPQDTAFIEGNPDVGSITLERLALP